MNARFSGDPEVHHIDARAAVLDQLATAKRRHSQAEDRARARSKHRIAYEHHGAVLLLERMSKEAER